VSPEKSFNWREDAACLGLDAAIFFPESEKEEEVVVEEICDSCIVQDPCLEYAVQREEKEGVWGGTTGKERRIIIRIRKTGS
jgi:WhiB family redox-sensing transcriptional regulator